MVYLFMGALLIILYFLGYVIYVEAVYLYHSLTQRLNRGKLRCDGCSKPIHIWQPHVDYNAWFNFTLATYSFHNQCMERWHDDLDRSFESLDQHYRDVHTKFFGEAVDG